MALDAKIEIGAEGFAVLTRLFVALKRAGRVIDVVWFQQSPDYARAVLALADELDDAEVNDAADRLRLQLYDYLSPRRNGSSSVRPPVAAAPVERERVVEPPPAPSAPLAPRYKTSLR